MPLQKKMGHVQARDSEPNGEAKADARGGVANQSNFGPSQRLEPKWQKGEGRGLTTRGTGNKRKEEGERRERGNGKRRRTNTKTRRR